jgi:hypothetical protein
VTDLNTPRRLLALAALAAFVSACSGGGSSPKVTVTPSASPTSSGSGGGGGGGSTDAYTCPTSDSVAAASSVGGLGRLGDAVRRMPNVRTRPFAVTPGRLAVTYSLSSLATSRAAIVSRERSLGAQTIREFDHPHLGTATRILSVPAERVASVEASFRSQAGVQSVSSVGYRRFAQTISKPYFTNDPYFTGFAHPVPDPGASSSAVPPATFEVGPYEENASVPGQWNMHVIGLEDAFAYSQENNGSTVVNGKALGSSSVKIAVIDVGEDTTHPELRSKVAYQRCFITNGTVSPNVQSTSDYTTDEDGHGTDVSGIAAADTNNALGFAGAGGAATIYAYRVQATPDDACASLDSASPPPECTVDTADIAAAVEDAVAENVDVINLSLGGSNSASVSTGCTNGQDTDPVEGPAIADAIAANIVVVAAAGNAGTEGVEAPACDPGVIAVGATSLSDGLPNGSENTSGSSSAPTEYVASYSDYGSPGASLNNQNAWGIVAPGGDPSSDTDADDLHWITDIWTTTPLDNSFAGVCYDYPSSATTNDCQVQIAGTSMATPTVAGAAALIIAANASYKSPTKMKQLLCTTADDIGDSHEGCGRLNVYRAMATAVGDRSLP